MADSAPGVLRVFDVPCPECGLPIVVTVHVQAVLDAATQGDVRVQVSPTWVHECVTAR